MQANNLIQEEGRPDAVKVIVANKIDLANRAFSMVQGHMLKQEQGFDEYDEMSV